VKLILHIGTHKTGSTALQQFLVANAESLRAGSIHYAVPPSAIKASAVVHALNVNNQHAVRDFFRSHAALARRRGAHTLVVSAESFYAMSLVPALCRREPCADLIDRDHVLIARLFTSIPDEISDRRVVGYFRRPDHFVESWYNQQVKYGSLFFGEFPDFLALAYPSLRYGAYMERWVDIFGQPNCSARIYEHVGKSVIDDFARSVLCITDLSPFVTERRATNERMSRDVLEFKREVNKQSRYEEMSLEREIFRLLDESLNLKEKEPEYYQSFLSPQDRAELLEDLSEEMAAFQSSFGLPPFPRFDLEAAQTLWRPYPGLAPARRQALERRYRRLKGRPRFRAERFRLKTRKALHRKAALMKRSSRGRG